MKQTDPDGSSKVFTFTSAETFNDNTLSDGQDSGATKVLPGSYRVQEGTETGWELTSISCAGDEGQGNASGADPDTNANPRTALFDVQAGEDITCTFNNREDSSIQFAKETDPDGSAQLFSFNSQVAFADTTLADGQNSGAPVKVTPGDYRVQEDSLIGWKLQSIQCSGDEGQGNASGADPDQNNPRTALFDVQAGEDIVCTFNNKKFDASPIVVKVGDDIAYHGDTISFNYTVTNVGNTYITNVQLSDDKCPNVQGPAKTEGPNDSGAERLDPGDSWVYTCTMNVPDHSDGEANPLTNVATVTGVDEFERPVEDTDSHQTKILHQAIAVDKAGPLRATAGDLVPYTLTVTNPGDTAFPAANVTVTDPQCTGVPALQTKNRDTGLDPSPETLDPGDSWVYGCSVQTAPGQQRVENIATVNGRDENGRTTEDSDTEVTPLAERVVEGERIEPGTARIAGRSGCVARAFYVTVRGTQIDRVVFRIDGKKRATLRAPDKRGRYRLRVNPRQYKAGSHVVTAQAVFSPDANTRTKKMKVRFQRCIRRTAPAFTG